MRKQWKLLALALLLITVMVSMGQAQADATPSSPAGVEGVDHPFPPADHFNNLSALTCAASHPSPPALSSWWIQYSNPFYYDVNHIRYTCIGHYHSGDVGVVCVWVGIYWTGGTITGPYDLDCAFF